MSTEAVVSITGAVIIALRIIEKVYDNRRADRLAAEQKARDEARDAQLRKEAAEQKARDEEQARHAATAVLATEKVAHELKEFNGTHASKIDKILDTVAQQSNPKPLEQQIADVPEKTADLTVQKIKDQL